MRGFLQHTKPSVLNVHPCVRVPILRVEAVNHVLYFQIITLDQAIQNAWWHCFWKKQRTKKNSLLICGSFVLAWCPDRSLWQRNYVWWHGGIVSVIQGSAPHGPNATNLSAQYNLWWLQYNSGVKTSGKWIITSEVYSSKLNHRCKFKFKCHVSLWNIPSRSGYLFCNVEGIPASYPGIPRILYSSGTVWN